MTMYIEWTDSEGNERETAVPSRWHICSHCRGEGKSSAYLGAFTQDEWAQEDDDFKEDYLSGAYDRPCEHCNGSGKVQVIDLDARLSDEQRAAIDARREQEESERETRQTQINEMLLEGSLRIGDLY